MDLADVIVLVSVSCLGCTAGAIDSDATMDANTLARVHDYKSAAKVNSAPLRSSIGAFNVNYFVDGDVAAFQRIHPEQSGSRATVAPGTVIVRECLDEKGMATKLTVMAKGPPGFDPSLGDWWFGVTDIDGIPLEDKGSPQIGRLAQCHDCHEDRAQDDFLFGVPATL